MANTCLFLKHIIAYFFFCETRYKCTCTPYFSTLKAVYTITCVKFIT